MVENRKDDFSYPKELCVDRHSEILSLGSREGQKGTRRAARCAIYRNKRNKVFQESTLCGLCPQLFYLCGENQCLFKYYFYNWNLHLSELDKCWMMLAVSSMMQLQLFPKVLPFLIHENICLTSHLPGRPCVLYLLLLIAFFSVYCSEVIKILRLCFPQVCRKIVIAQKQFCILMFIRPSYTSEEFYGFSLDLKANADAECWMLAHDSHPTKWGCSMWHFSYKIAFCSVTALCNSTSNYTLV